MDVGYLPFYVSKFVPDCLTSNYRYLPVHISGLFSEYEADTFYFGALVGRFANNISGGRFTLKDGSTHQLSINNGENHLHGGTVGFNKVSHNT